MILLVFYWFATVPSYRVADKFHLFIHVRLFVYFFVCSKQFDQLIFIPTSGPVT